MSKLYKVRPSTILNLEDEYTSYCFDEACAIIISKIKDGENPVFKKRDGNIERPHYNRMSDLYNSMGFKNGNYKK